MANKENLNKQNCQIKKYEVFFCKSKVNVVILNDLHEIDKLMQE